MKEPLMLETINKICAQLPPGWTIKLCMTHRDYGEPYISLVNPHSGFPSLPDFSDKTIIEQLEDALLYAKNFAEKD